METETRQSARGAQYWMIAAGIVTASIAIYSVIEPEYKYISIWAVMLGSVGTWGLYLTWRRKLDRHGLNLMDEDED